MTESTSFALAKLCGEPFAKVYRWMRSDLNLSGDMLTIFALIFEKEVTRGDESNRIDGDYIAKACGGDHAETFAIFSRLVARGFLTPDFDGGDFTTAFKLADKRIKEICNIHPNFTQTDDI